MVDLKNLTIDKKMLIVIISITSFVLLISYITLSYFENDVRNKVYLNTKNSLIDKMNERMENKFEVGLTNAISIANDKSLSIALKEDNRNIAIEALKDLALKFKDGTNYKNIKVHIHTKEVNSFIRMWKLSKFGDDLKGFRNTILKVRDSKRPLNAIEIGRAGLTIRSLVPIMEKDEYLGSLEFMQGFNSIAKLFLDEGNELLVLMDKKYSNLADLSKRDDVVGNYVLSQSSFNKSFLNDAKSVNFNELFNNKQFMSENYFYTYKEIKDFQNRVVGIYLMGISMEKLLETLDSAKSLLYVALILSFILGFIIMVAILIAMRVLVVKPFTHSIETIVDANEQIKSASDQIADSSVSLADSTTKQVENVDKVASIIEEATEINHQNVEYSKEASSIADSANFSAKKGHNKMNELVVSMEEINVSSEKISKIIKTIDEIAFQTNLLSLNAAVEAARAGEHGLGFAVVAEEVKALATKSATSAKETAEIIEKSLEDIRNGTKVVKETNESFEDILDNVLKTSQIINRIQESITEQTKGMNEVSISIKEIEKMTNQNATVSEENAAAAEELNAQTFTMLESVKRIAKMVGAEIE